MNVDERGGIMLLLCIWINVVYFSQFILSQSPCTLPSQFQNSVWVDSDKGDLTFDTVNMTGWDFVSSGSVPAIIEEWECYHTGTIESELFLIMKCKENVIYSADSFTPYLCMKLTEVSPYLYYYYLHWAEQASLNKERITTVSPALDITDAYQQLCLDISNPLHSSHFPETSEYHVLVKKGNELDAKQECPSTFFGEYSYKVKDIDAGSETCGNGDEKWDVCADYSRMTFDYSTCNTQISYSGNGSVFCLVSITSGSYVYHTVYNEDNEVDVSSSTYRFTCFMSVMASDGSLNVSQTPGSCKKGQTPDNQPVFASNNSAAGLNLQLTPRVLCPKTSPIAKTSDAVSSGLSSGAVVGIVFGILILIAAVILIVLICMKVKCRQPKKKKEEKEKTPVTSPRSKKLSVDIDDLPHQSSPHRNDGPNGTAPVETKFSGDHTISKTPTLDHKYNPFSAFPLFNGKISNGEDKLNGVPRSQQHPHENDGDSKEASFKMDTSEIKKPEQKGARTVSKSIQTDNLFVEDLEKNENCENASFSRQNICKDVDDQEKLVARNETPKAIVLSKNNSLSNSSDVQYLKRKSPAIFEEQRRPTINDIKDIERDYKKVPAALNGFEKHILQTLDQTKAKQKTPSQASLDTTSNKLLAHRETPPLKTAPPTESSLPNNPDIIKTHFQREDMKYSTTFLQAPKKSPPGLDNEQNFKRKKNNKVGAMTHKSVSVKTPKNSKQSKQSSKIKAKSKKKGQQAFNSLIQSKSVGFNRNKTGTFYNESIPTVSEPQSYLNISESKSTDKGICYDDDNERLRAMGYWGHNDTLNTFVSANSQSENQFDDAKDVDAEELKLALGSPGDRSVSRLTLGTDISARGSLSTRSISAITSRIDSRGAKYFIENESSSIAIHVKINDVPDDLGQHKTTNDDVDVENSEQNQDEDDGEDEDEDEGSEDFDEVKNEDDIQTSMSVFYGPTNEEGEEDPDRMVLRGYEPHLLTIKE